MFNVCHHCGQYRVDKTIDHSGPYAVCPECGHRHRFTLKPLLVVSGASGAGKSAVCSRLVGRIRGAVLLDSDILWGPAFDQPETNYRDYFETWLRLSKNIAQSGSSVVLFGAGIGVPDNLEPCIERRYTSTIHYLALTCSDEVLTQRLAKRPAWRRSGDPDFITAHLQFNQWFKDYQPTSQQPPITTLDTTRTPLEETVSQVEAWIQKNLR